MARTIEMKNGFWISEIIKPSTCARWERKLRASRFGRKSNSSTAAKTRRRTSSIMCGFPVKTLDTEAVDTPARRATSDSFADMLFKFHKGCNRLQPIVIDYNCFVKSNK